MTRDPGLSPPPPPPFGKAPRLPNVRPHSIARRDGTPAAKFFGCASRQLDLEECSPGPSGAGVFLLHSSRARPRQLLRRARGAVPPPPQLAPVPLTGRSYGEIHYVRRALASPGGRPPDSLVNIAVLWARPGPPSPGRVFCAHKSKRWSRASARGENSLARASCGFAPRVYLLRPPLPSGSDDTSSPMGTCTGVRSRP